DRRTSADSRNYFRSRHPVWATALSRHSSRSSRNVRANASSTISLKAEDSEIAIATASGSARGQGQRVARISRKAFGFRQPEFLAHDIRAKHHGDHLVGRMPPAHAFASHSAIRGDDQPFGRNVFQRL